MNWINVTILVSVAVALIAAIAIAGVLALNTTPIPQEIAFVITAAIGFLTGAGYQSQAKSGGT